MRNHPLFLVSGSGGGRWYNFHEESSAGQRPTYRHLLVQGTRQPLAFYQLNVEHVSGGDANMELRNAQYVSVYGLKCERHRCAIRVTDCDHIRYFGHGGNAGAMKSAALIEIENTPNFLFANLADRPMWCIAHPEKWRMLTPAGFGGVDVVEERAYGEDVVAPLDPDWYPVKSALPRHWHHFCRFCTPAEHCFDKATIRDGSGPKDFMCW